MTEDKPSRLIAARGCLDQLWSYYGHQWRLAEIDDHSLPGVEACRAQLIAVRRLERDLNTPGHEMWMGT